MKQRVLVGKTRGARRVLGSIQDPRYTSLDAFQLALAELVRGEAMRLRAQCVVGQPSMTTINVQGALGVVYCTLD